MSKRISKAGNIKYALSGDDEFIAAVDPGETFVVECAINVNDGTIRQLGQQLTEKDVTLPYVNGAAFAAASPRVSPMESSGPPDGRFY